MTLFVLSWQESSWQAESLGCWCTFLQNNLTLVWLCRVKCRMWLYFFRHLCSGARPPRCSLVQLVGRQTAVCQAAWPPVTSGFAGVMVVHACAVWVMDNLNLKFTCMYIERRAVKNTQPPEHSWGCSSCNFFKGHLCVCMCVLILWATYVGRRDCVWPT